MANYPSTFITALRFTTRHKTFISNLESGKILRRKLWTDPLYVISGEHRLSAADFATLENFFRETAQGMLVDFCLTDPLSRTWTDMYVGTGDGSTTVFDLPFKNSSSYTVYNAGVAKTGGGVDYTFGDGTGTDGRDKITWNSAPADGNRISLDATGNRAWAVIFASDELPWERTHASQRDSVQVTFLEVRD